MRENSYSRKQHCWLLKRGMLGIFVWGDTAVFQGWYCSLYLFRSRGIATKVVTPRCLEEAWILLRRRQPIPLPRTKRRSTVV